MKVHLGAAICGVAIMLAYPSAAITAIAIDYSYAAEKDADTDSARERVKNHGNAPGTVATLKPQLKIAAHRSLLAPLAITRLELIKRTAVASSPSIVGIASTYNPYRLGKLEGGIETASGESYDPTAWAAAIQTDLRGQFGGVGYGTSYRPTYALVESADRQAVIKINDVGPLKSGRVIDFNEQTMRYFDPTLQLGLIHRVRVTPLLGDDWSPGPIEGDS